MPTDTTMLTIKEAVLRIKNAILQSQQQTVQNINVNVLSLYYSIGEFISRNTRRQQWGSGAIKTISEQLQKELPGLRGYSETNLKNMRLFYEGWCCYIIRQPAADELPLDDSKKNRQPTADDSENMLVIVGGLQFTSSAFSFNIAHDFLSISFTHHMEILSKTNTLDERLFYIQQTSNYKWDKYKLREALKQDCYHHRGAMPNNFLQTLPQRLQALKAIEMFKDEYFLDYLNTEELGVRDLEDIDERVVEQSIVHNIKNFIMTFGTDFTFVGNQYHLEKFGKAHFVDLLFYNRELACLVAVELKMGEFKPMYLGQLQTYLQLLDDKVRKPNENPSIGIILCQDADKAYVEYVIQKYDSPMGVATFYTSADMPEKLRHALPNVDSLRQLLKGEYHPIIK
ncbi:MAG: YhcG family protein [Paludibacteraceae bacterium]